MREIVELSSLDLRYEGHRLRDNAREARLLASIAERGIEEPLGGVDTPAARFLLDGFKRCRSAKKLSIACVPYVSLGEEEATGILNLMRASTDKGLGILEQARFVVDLLSIHGMNLAEVAQTLSRSKGWVSMRQRLLDEMSPAIQEILFRGAFPVYSYMYTLRPFMRMNAGRQPEIERFVEAVAGQRLSVRDIELLAHAYFRGPASLREAIEGGKLGWSLDQLKHVPEDREGCNTWERGLLRDLELLRKSMQRVMAKCHDPRLTSRAFFAQANLLTAGLLSTLAPFGERMKEFHDRSGQPKLDRKKIMSLYDRFDYMTKQQNIVWLGPTGCGKSGLATAFLLQALDRGYRGYFITFPELVAELYASLADRSEQQALRKYARYDCLVIDEVGYVEIEPAQVGLFFTLMQKRHKTKTTLITSNLGFSEWGSLLKNNQLTGALLNRLTETSHVINMKSCHSLRPKLDEGGESDVE